MHFLTLIPVLSLLLLLSPSTNAASPARYQKAHDAVIDPHRGTKTDGRIDQFRDLWKQHSDARGTAPPGKLDRLVDNAEAREHGKYTKTGNAGKNVVQPQGSKSGPQKKKKAMTDFRLPATLRDGGVLEKRQFINQPVENAPKQCRGSAAPQGTGLEGNAKYADPKSFFRFSERELGVKYSPEQLAAAKNNLSNSLSAAGERERERKSDDPPPVQYDDEFLQFAGLTREEVAPPTRDIFQEEAKKCGLDKFSDVKKRKEVPESQGKALFYEIPPPPPPYGIPPPAPHPGYYWKPNPPPPPPVHPAYYPPSPPRPCPPCKPNCPVPCKNYCPEPEGKLDVDIVSDGSETLVMLIEDIRRYIIFYEANNAEDIILSAEGDTDIDISVPECRVPPDFFNIDADVAPYSPYGEVNTELAELADFDTGLSLAELGFALSQPGQDGPYAEAVEHSATKAKEVEPEPEPEAYLKRKEFDDHINNLGPWCPIGDQQVLKVLEAMV